MFVIYMSILIHTFLFVSFLFPISCVWDYMSVLINKQTQIDHNYKLVGTKIRNMNQPDYKSDVTECILCTAWSHKNNNLNPV
jgi:hypothetical protein